MMAAGAALAVAAVVVMVLVATALIDGDDDDGTTVGVDGEGGTTEGANGPPEFIEVFPPEAPRDQAGDARTDCGRPERISWSQAVDYEGQRVAVFGPVTGIGGGDEGATELTLGRTEDEVPVTVVLTETAKQGMAGTPEELFGGEAVCVIGVLRAIGAEIRVFVNESTDIAVL